MKSFKIAVAALYGILVLGLVGTIDYQDEIIEGQIYVNKVCRGEMIDYKKIQPECL
jgi:hypothetical protein